MNKTETEEEPELNEWEERQQAKAERYRELAEKHHQASHDRYESSNKAVAGIPFGQPILVGHHSEGAHRSALNRSWNHMDKSVEHENKAEYYERKAKGAENNKTISSDDPDAVKKLKAKLEKLEETRTKTKDYNKKARKEGKETLPSWHFQNLSGNIRRVKQRIKKLEEQQDMKDQEWSFGEITVKVNTDANRVQVLFPGVPSKETRDKLKRNGFRWSRYHMAWQRMINNYAIYLAKDIAGGING